MTYSHPAPSSSIAVTIPRRSKSESNLQLCCAERSFPPKNTKPRLPSKIFTFSAVDDADKCCLRLETFEKWNALADREGCQSSYYQVLRFHSREKRAKICTWCYNVVDSLGIDRRVVSIALSLFDRYMSDHFSEHERDRDCWLLVVTCLCIAIKLHSSQNETCLGEVMMKLRLSCRFSVQQVAKTELRVCEVLEWYLNPPVPVMYLEVVSPFIDEIASEKIPIKAKHDITDLARFLMELCVYCPQMCGERQSSVAHAAILVSMNHLNIPTKTVKKWLSLTLNHSSHLTDGCVPKLQDILAANHHGSVCSSSATMHKTGVHSMPLVHVQA